MRNNLSFFAVRDGSKKKKKFIERFRGDDKIIETLINSYMWKF